MPTGIYSRTAAHNAANSVAKKGRKIRPHSAEHRAALSAAHKDRTSPLRGVKRPSLSAAMMGHLVSAETRNKIGTKNSVALKGNPSVGAAGARRERAKGMNEYEQFVQDVILVEFPEVIWQQPFGSRVVDFYSPAHHLAFEVDSWGHGAFLQESDPKRDVELMDNFGLLVVRITHDEIDELMEVAA